MKLDREIRPGVADQVRPTLAFGRLNMTTAGFGLIRVDREDVFVPASSLGAALHGDDVEVEVKADPRGLRGRITRVLSRTLRRLSGVVDGAGRQFTPDDERFPRSLRCLGSIPGGQDGNLVCGAELASDVDGEIDVQIVKCFGSRGSPSSEEDAILWRENVDEEFPPWVTAAALGQARTVSTESREREDLRGLDFVTIDPATAEDHDDAVFADRAADGSVRVVVAIADVASFVPNGTAIDMEARRRGASLYFPNRVVPMLPPLLSSDAASLLPDVDRPAIALELSISPDGRVHSRRLVSALIRVKSKLTYEQAAEVLREPPARTFPGELLRLLDDVAQTLRRSRCERGAIVVTTPQIRIVTDADTGRPQRIERQRHDPWLSRASQLVEELMLLANETVATILREKGADGPFRIHPAPIDERLASAVKIARERGVIFDQATPLDAETLRRVLSRLPDPTLRNELMGMFLELMPGALYASQDGAHFALASERYVHFTSPIRRYADLAVHRAIHAFLRGKDALDDSPDPEMLNARQERARLIHREVAALYAAILMAEHRHSDFPGTVLKTTKRWLTVELDDPAVCVRCPLPARELKADRVLVRIDGVSIAAKRIDGSVRREIDGGGRS